MSHFRFHRTTQRSSEQRIRNSIILDDDPILESDYPILHQESSSSMLSDSSSSSSSGSGLSEESSDSSTILAPRQPSRVVVEEQRCWICFGDSSDSQGKWIKPCQCSLEAHQSCLLDWIAENQKSSPNKKVNCPQCATTYQLSQKSSFTLTTLNLIDTAIRISTPFVVVVGLGCSLLVTCTTYGAFSIMKLFGSRDGERLIGAPSRWTYKTWIGLPLIPVLLVSTKTKWGDAILPVAAVCILRATGATPRNIRFTWPLSPALTIGIIPWVRLLYKNVHQVVQRYLIENLSLQNSPTARSSRERRGSNEISDRERVLEFELIIGRNTNSASRAFLGALLWPVTSSIMGELLNRFQWVRRNFPDTFQRNMFGGCLFVVAKDIGSLIYKYERVRQHRSRRVKSYEEVLQSRSQRQ